MRGAPPASATRAGASTRATSATATSATATSGTRSATGPHRAGRSATPGPADLVAVTRPLEAEPDLIALGSRPDGVLWANEELGLAGTGVALRLEHPGDGTAVADALAAIESDDPLARPGTGPVAFGSLPFRPDAPGHLVVPRRILGRSGGQWWETVVSIRPGSDASWPAGATAAAAEGDAAANGTSTAADLPAATGLAPDEFDLRPSLSHAEWKQSVADAVETIRGGAMDKVVLARRVDVVANRPFVIAEVLSRLTALYPACMIFHVEGFIGASPELLVRREGDRFASHPLAGTVARSGDRAADDALIAGLLASPKERWEHRIVIDQLGAALTPWCEHLDVPGTPSVLGLRNVSHLATLITGSLAERAGGLPTALDLVRAICPTAAVAGHPTERALAYIADTEGFDRGPYAGPVGWVDARGDGAWALGIRSARIDGERASMYAGVGVVGDSDPVAELAETQLKLQALLAALVRP
jgi:menaquinone-specific isochorismate synthase